MPTLREVLEAELVADPDDLATHMAYADLLQEQGDPRGEFISLHLSLEQLPTRSGRRLSLRRRIHRLLNDHAAEWLGELGPHLLEVPHMRAVPYAFARGWLDTLELENLGVEVARVVVRARELRLLRVLKIDEVQREHYGDYEPGTDVPGGLSHPALAVLAQSPMLGNVRRLELATSPYGIDGRDLPPLLNSPHLAKLTSLRLRLPVVSYLQIQTLTEARLFERLRELELVNCFMNDNVARMLAEAGLTHLTRLNIDGNSLTEEGIAALRGTGVPLEVGTQFDPEEIPF